MKLNGRDAARYVTSPDPDSAGALVYGGDPMRVALRRQDLVAALVGPDGETEMRLTRIAASDLRREPALIDDAMRAQGFFPGTRVALVEDATDATVDVLSSALTDWRPGDAHIVVTAGSLAARSKLRKLFEAHGSAVALPVYDDPPDRAELEATLRAAGIGALDPAAMEDIVVLSRVLDPGDLRQTIEKLALYKLGDPTPLGPEDVAAVAPVSVEAAVDDMLTIVADSRTRDIGPVMRRLEAQGVAPVALCIGALRYFRALHTAASDPGGVQSGLSRARPPVFGPRRASMARQATAWGVQKLELAVQMIFETDLGLRSSTEAPAMAAMERTLIRIAMLGDRR